MLFNKWGKLVKKARKKVKNNFPQIYDSLDFGAYIEPQQYFVSYIFKTDLELKNADESGLLKEINQFHIECLKNLRYPDFAIKPCVFASQEDCNNRYDGNWYYYYK